jgi:hypothetical protein
MHLTTFGASDDPGMEAVGYGRSDQGCVIPKRRVHLR